MRITLWVGLGLVFAAVLAVVGISLYAAFSLTRFEIVPVTSDPSDVGLEYSLMSFTSRDGLALKGWWLESAESDRAVVIVHGSEGNRVRPPERMLGIAEALVQHNYNVLMFDMRGHGESEAEHVSAGLNEKNDLLAALDYVQERGIEKIGVIGFSLGAATSLMTLAETDAIDALVSDSGYADLADIINSEFEERSNLPRFFIPLILFTAKILYGVDFAAVRPIEAVQVSTVPIFVIHGALDSMVPVAHAYRLAEASGNRNSRLWILQDAGHANPYLIRPAEYMKNVLDFFDQNIR